MSSTTTRGDKDSLAALSYSPPVSSPRFRRMGMASPPSDFSLSAIEMANNDSLSTPPPSPLTSSPPVPPRSPLRSRQLRSISSVASSIGATSNSTSISSSQPSTPFHKDFPRDSAAIVQVMPIPFPHQNRSLPSLSGLLDGPDQDEAPSKPHYGHYESPLPLSPMDDEPSSSTSSLLPPIPMTKRHHALHELLSSERNYTSDLALIRDVHIPLALGKPLKFHTLPISPPKSSSSSSRTLSTASDSSTTSLGPPMTVEDTKIIFGNIQELAVFSDIFGDQLEDALGNVLEGGHGEDRVGALFLEIIPSLERPYKQYITRHPTALAHLSALPQTPALTAYLAQTRSVASSLSHAWDISSLLIKPVQRLLKYSLLLAAIIDETPDSHGDKANLIQAKQRMEEVARGVNEDRRRWEVVKEVLMAKSKSGGEAAATGPGGKKKNGLSVGVAASVNLSRMKSISLRTAKALEGNEEVEKVEIMEAELKRIHAFALNFAKGSVEWGRMMKDVVSRLKLWAIGFGKVIGLSEEQGSEAFDAFLSVVDVHLGGLCLDLEAAIQENLLAQIARLRQTREAPVRLIAAMKEEEPAHYHLLNMNVSAKNRPAPGLLESSQNYLALRGQLCKELPTYLQLMHKGVAAVVLHFAEIQSTFWGDVRDRWQDLWDALRVEGEMNAGASETVSVWWDRWQEVDNILAGLNIVNPKKIYVDPIASQYSKHLGVVVPPVRPTLDPAHSASRRPPTAPAQVKAMLSALDPSHAASSFAPTPETPHVSAPHALSPRRRSRGLSDPSSGKKSLGRRSSSDSLHNESLYSGKSNKSGKDMHTPSRRHHPDEFGEYVDVVPVPMPMYPRTKSAPFAHAPQSMQSSISSSSSSKAVMTGIGEEEYVPRYPIEHYDDQERGRTARKQSLRRKFTDTLRPSSSQRHRSPSTKSPATTGKTYFTRDTDVTPMPSMPTSQSQRHSWAHANAKYLCQVIHPCQPPPDVSYYSFPFFRLKVGDVFQVLQEAGHPSLHAYLPLHVDDGEDCLLLVRDQTGEVGWALASFLIPLDYE